MKNSSEVAKTLVQCDFDGTITKEDVSFLLLDAFADGDWRQLLTEYIEGKIPVGYFNTKAFAMVKADRQAMVELARRKVEIRPGFNRLLDCCRQNSFPLVIVSNGLDFYIEAILKDVGAEAIEVFAAQTRFSPSGLEVKYVGPDGSQLQKGFKEAYTRLFLGRGYQVVYVGNGPSDMPAAELAYRTFATDELLTLCKEANHSCIPFTDLNDVVEGLDCK